MAIWQTAEILPGVRLHSMQTDKFHSGYFSLELLCPLQAENVSRNALLMDVLRRGTRSCPDMTRITERLHELSGAVIAPFLRQMGEITSIGLQTLFPDDRYLPGEERHLEKLLSFCGEMLLDPATRGGLLNEEFVRSERQNLHDRIASLVNDKRSYAKIRMRKLMFAREPYGIYPLGEAENALKVHYQQLTKYYRALLRTAPIELHYCGSAEPQRVEEAVREAFLTMPPGERDRMPELGARPYPDKLRRVTEEMDVEQGNLAIGCRLIQAGTTDQAALSVMNELFGGGPGSRLFRNVREKKSLCYYIGSGVERFKEVMTVSAGIAFDKREETEEAIFAELRELASGAFSAEELNSAKRSAAASYRSGLDQAATICSFRLGQEMKGAIGDLEYLAEMCELVRAEDVQAIASRMKPELSYFLRKGEEA